MSLKSVGFTLVIILIIGITLLLVVKSCNIRTHQDIERQFIGCLRTKSIESRLEPIEQINIKEFERIIDLCKAEVLK